MHPSQNSEQLSSDAKLENIMHLMKEEIDSRQEDIDWLTEWAIT